MRRYPQRFPGRGMRSSAWPGCASLRRKWAGMISSLADKSSHRHNRRTGGRTACGIGRFATASLCTTMRTLPCSAPSGTALITMEWMRSTARPAISGSITARGKGNRHSVPRSSAFTFSAKWERRHSALDGPGDGNFNLAALKNLAHSESKRLQFRREAFKGSVKPSFMGRRR